MHLYSTTALAKHYLSILREDGQVEVVVVVGDGNLTVGVDPDTDGIVGNA